MNPAPTTFTGPLGSTFHVLRADADTVAALAAIDWRRRFRRVCLDPARGVITLMSPSRLHEDLTTMLGDIVDVAAEILSGAGRGIGSTRLRGSGDPPDTGMEPDCAFYVGERARAYSVALREGEAAADAFLEHTAPDLVVEVEITNADQGKAERYAEMGVRELWRLHGRKGLAGARSRIPRIAPGRAPSTTDRIGRSWRSRVCRRARGGGAGEVRTHQERTDRSHGPSHATVPAAHRTHPRGRAVLRRMIANRADARGRRVLPGSGARSRHLDGPSRPHEVRGCVRRDAPRWRGPSRSHEVRA